MNIKNWKLLSFLAIVVITTILIFPSKRNLLKLYIESGMFMEARAMVDNLKLKNPYNTDLLLLSYELYIKQGEPEAAIATLNELIQNDSNISYLYELAGIFESIRESAQAVKIWEKIVQKNPKDIEVWLKLIEYYRYIGNLEKQVNAIRKATAIQNAVRLQSSQDPLFNIIDKSLNDFLRRADEASNRLFIYSIIENLFAFRQIYFDHRAKDTSDDTQFNENMRIQLLELFVRFGLHTKAAQTAQLLDTEYNLNHKTTILLSEIMQWNGMPENAFFLIKELSQQTKSDADILMAIKLARSTNDVDLMQEAAALILELKTDNPSLLLEAAALYLNLNNNQKAYEIYQTLANEKNPEIITKILDTAGFTADKRFIKDAIAYSLSLFPHHPEILKKIAQMYQWIEMPEESYLVLEKLVKEQAFDPEEIKELIKVAESSNNKELHSRALKLSEEICLKNQMFLIEIVRSYKKLGNQIDTINAYKKYLPFHQDDHDAHINLAEEYIKADQLENAYAVYQRQLLLNQNDHVILSELIKIATWLNRFEERLVYQKKLAQLLPENADNAKALADSFVESGQFNSALEFLDKAVKIRPDDLAAIKKRAKLYHETGNFEKLIDDLRNVEKNNGLNSEEKILLATAYLEKRMVEPALKYLTPFEDAENLSKNAGLLLLKAYELLSDKTNFKKITKRLVKENARDENFLADLGMRSLQFKDYDLASFCFQASLKIDPKQLIALKGSGFVFIAQNKLDQALKSFTTYYTIKPEDYEVIYQLAEVNFALGHKEKAMQFDKIFQKRASKIKD